MDCASSRGRLLSRRLLLSRGLEQPQVSPDALRGDRELLLREVQITEDSSQDAGDGLPQAFRDRHLPLRDASIDRHFREAGQAVERVAPSDDPDVQRRGCRRLRL
jgi:hypothetical protein